MAVEIDLSGQTALITGGATGLGEAIARTLGVAGARIALNDLSQDRADAACTRLSLAGIECIGVAADVRDREAVDAMVDETGKRLGGPEIIVANAGIYPNTPFLDMMEDEWDRVLDTNLKGVFLTCQAAARAMIAAGTPGRIVTLSSGAANSAIWGWAHYCASKAGVVMLTKAMALELGRHASGSMRSAWVYRCVGRWRASRRGIPAGRAERFQLGRPGTDDIAARADAGHAAGGFRQRAALSSTAAAARPDRSPAHAGCPGASAVGIRRRGQRLFRSRTARNASAAIVRSIGGARRSEES